MAKKEIKNELKVQLTLPTAQSPLRANSTDAGADLISPVDFTISPHNNIFIDFGIAIELPANTVGYIIARSGLGNNGITPRNCVGVIDEKYRGNIGIMLENKTSAMFVGKAGDRIAQLVVMPVITPKIKVVQNLNMDGDRQGGFGSSGR